MSYIYRPFLFHLLMIIFMAIITPIGLVSEWRAIAIGDGSDKLMTILEENYGTVMKQSLEKGKL